MKKILIRSALLSTGLMVWACADADNPTALADLEPITDFQIEASEVETMHAVEIVARVREGGSLMRLRNAQIEIRPPTGPTRLVALEGDEHGYSAHVRFYEAGEHHLHLLGQPERHHLMIELGEHEIDVERQHQIHEDHRFELEVSPAPIVLGVPARITVRGWEIEHDGTLGHAAEGLELHATLHMPDGVEVPIQLTEVEHGEYQVSLSLFTAGSYELSVEIEGEEGAHSASIAVPEEGHDDEHGDGIEFEIHVPSADGDTGDTPTEEGGDHGHGP